MVDKPAPGVTLAQLLGIKPKKKPEPRRLIQSYEQAREQTRKAHAR